MLPTYNDHFHQATKMVTKKQPGAARSLEDSVIEFSFSFKPRSGERCTWLYCTTFAMSHSVDWTTIGKSSSRCIKLGDVKIMWGKTTVVMNGTGANSFGASTVTLPESFGNDGYSAVASPQDPGISNALKCTVQSVTKTNFQITVGTAAGVATASVPVRWIAIG